MKYPNRVYFHTALVLVLSILILPACSRNSPGTSPPEGRLLQRTGQGPVVERTAIPLLPTPTQAEPVIENPQDAVDLVWVPPTHTSTPSSLPDYPIPSPTSRPVFGPNGISPDDSPVTRIVISSIGVDTIVKFVPFNGKTWLIGGLKQEVAWMGDTSWPGLGGNTGLAGHVDLSDGSPGPFWNLKDLQPGDEVTVYTEKYIFTYQVREQVVVGETDISVIDATDNPQVTLITCTAWDTDLRTYLQRLIVFADLVSVSPL